MKLGFKKITGVLGAIVLGALVLEAVLRLLPIRSVWTRTSHVKNLEFEYDLTLNSDYFRDEEFKKEKEPGTLRVFLIGDSFVFGSGVVQGQTIDKLLEKKLKVDFAKTGCEVFNLGKPGAGPKGYYEVAKQFSEYQPDLVVLSLYVDNDIQSLRWWEGSKLLKLVSKLPDKLSIFLWKHGSSDCFFPVIKKRVLDKSYQEKACQGLINPYHFTERIPLGENHAYYRGLAKVFQKDPATKQSILALRDLFPHVPFLLLVNPSLMQVSPRYFPDLRKIGFPIESDEVIGNEVQDAVLSWARMQGIEALDVLPLMRQREEEKFFHTLDGHYNEAGNELVAGALSYRIIQIHSHR